MVQRLSAPQKEAVDVVALPKGSYAVEIMKITEAQSSNGNPQMAVDYRVVDGPYAETTFKDWVFKTQKAAWRLQQFFEAADPNESMWQKTDTGAKDADNNPIFDITWERDNDFEGFQLIVECDRRTNPKNGKEYTNVVGFSPLPQAAPQQTAAPVQPYGQPQQPAQPAVYQPPVAAAQPAQVQQQPQAAPGGRRMPAQRS